MILMYNVCRGDNMKSFIELFWNASYDDLKRGYTFDEETQSYLCLLCGKSFKAGYIYPFKEELLDAPTRMAHHVEEVHDGMVNSLLSMDKKYTGLSDIQISILNEFNKGKDDTRISKDLGISKSNVRNHRFRLKEKAKQAKVFLTIFEMIESKTDSNQKIIDFHHTAKQVDERYAITESEKNKCLSKLFDEEGKLNRFPSKEKEKLIVLLQVIKTFKTGIIYSEKEVNRKLKEIFPDYALIRRYLIEYGFLDRKSDCSEYWIKTKT